MNAILDSHAFIWMDSEPAKVSPTVRRYLSDPAWTIYLSVVSLWEITIKVAIGKLALTDTLERIVAAHQATTPILLLPFHYGHVLEVARLPMIHKTPSIGGSSLRHNLKTRFS